MFGSVQPTPYDLAFSIAGVPVRILPTFWLVSVLMGSGLLSEPGRGPVLLLIWVGVVLVSIFVHEMGHALMARIFGYWPRVFLYSFGGLAMYEPDRDYSAAKSILISLAGPFAGFCLGLACVAAGIATGIFSNADAGDGFLLEAIGMGIQVNIFWTLVNLLPVLPLDGGQVSREVCLSASPQRGMTAALWISIVVAALVAAGAFMILRDTYVGILFAILAVQNYMEYQQRNQW